MKTLFIIAYLFIGYNSIAQTDSVLVMIEDQLVLLLEEDFESEAFSEINETFHPKYDTPKSIKSELLQTALNEKKMHFSILNSPVTILTK